MIQKLPNGAYRVRYDFGFLKRYNYLKKQTKLTEKQAEEFREVEEKSKTKTRRSYCCKHLWQAEHVEKIFKAAYELESAGKIVPPSLLKIEEVPDKMKYLEELAYSMASLCGFQEELIDNIDYTLFLDQVDANKWWLRNLEISPEDIRVWAKTSCIGPSDIELPGKTIIFTGAVTGFTGCEDYLDCLRTLALEIKADAIVTVGEWVKTIFLHKSSRSNRVLPALRRLANSVKILAIRSNRDIPEMLHELKDIGITFINGIEDEKNVFTGLRLYRSSTKDQLSRFEESFTGKNVFAYTTYVGLKTQAQKGGDPRYLVGSGSSGYNTPSARLWTTAYDSQLFHSGIRDNIGGHILRFDEDANVFPTTFRYLNEQIYFGGNVYRKRGFEKGETHVLVSDFHASSLHKEGFGCLLHFLKNNPVKSISINGDFFSNKILCHHHEKNIREQVRAAKKDLDFLKEIAHAKSCLMLISESVGNAKKIFKLGNHEVNSIRNFVKKDTNHFLESMLDLTVLLGLEELGFEIVQSEEAYEVGGLTILHGHEMTTIESDKIFGKNTVRGHSHGLCIGPYSMTLACLEDPSKAGYLPHKYTSWAPGFAVITELDGDATLPQPITIKGKRYAGFDRIHEVSGAPEIPLPETLSLTYKLNWTGREDL